MYAVLAVISFQLVRTKISVFVITWTFTSIKLRQLSLVPGFVNVAHRLVRM